MVCWLLKLENLHNLCLIGLSGNNSVNPHVEYMASNSTAVLPVLNMLVTHLKLRSSHRQQQIYENCLINLFKICNLLQTRTTCRRMR